MVSKPSLSFAGKIAPGEEIILKISNPGGKEGILLVQINDKSTTIKIPPVTSYEVKQKIPSDQAGQTFISNFWTRINGVIYHSNTLPIQIPDPDSESNKLNIKITARPIRATDDPAGWKQNAVVTLPVFLKESDDILVNADGTCNLKAELVSGQGIQILSQQFNVQNVYNRNDLSKRRARIVHGYVVVNNVNGHKNEVYDFIVKATTSTRAKHVLTNQAGNLTYVDTGAAKFTLNASEKGFWIRSIEVAKQHILSPNGGNLYIYRRHFDGSPGTDYLTSNFGKAKIEVVKDGSSYCELMITGTMLPENATPATVPQKYFLLLKFHIGSTEIDGELMLVNTNVSLDGNAANYTIPYDGFGLKLLFTKDADATVSQQILLDSGESEALTINTGDQTALLLGYRAARWQGEYEGLWDGHYWPENQRTDGSKPGDLNFVTKGYQFYINNNLDERYKSHFGDILKYPRGCLSHLIYENNDFAFQVGSYAEYEQPIGIVTTDLNNQILIDLQLSSKLSVNKFGKSLPFRTTIRKSFFVDLDYFAPQGMINKLIANQTPYIGIYSTLSDYNKRGFNFEWVNTDERFNLLQTLGFMKSGDSTYQYKDMNRGTMWRPFYIGSNRTGGIMNWDQALIQYCFALHGFMGWLMGLRLQLTFHSILGRRQYEDPDLQRGVLNPSQPCSTLWPIDIEHEDHKGYHAGVCLFGNPLDVIALSRMAYETLGENVGSTLWIRACGNQIGRNMEEQSVLRSLLVPKSMPGKTTLIEDDILPNMLNFFRDFFSRRVDPNDPFNTSGWMSEPGPLPPFEDDPEDVDWPVADMKLPYRYLTIKKAARVKMIDEFHLSKGLAAFNEFMIVINDFPSQYQDAMAGWLETGRYRQIQRAMTFAQYYTFLYPYCKNFIPQCGDYQRLTPWERIKRQKKYYPSDMTICDERTMDEDNTWGGYDYMDCYADAAMQFINEGDDKSAFYILRAALNHMAMNRWDRWPSKPCDPPIDNKNNDFFWSTQYSSYNRIWVIIRDHGFLDKFTHEYPMLFPTEIKYEVA